MPANRSNLDQTDITYVRPGSWSASPGIAGIDELHSFAADARKLQDPPNPSLPGLSNTPPGPSAVNDTKAPAMFSRGWWQHRNRSQIELNAQSGDDWTVTTQEPQNDTQRPRDPRTVSIPAPRWTAQSGPVLQAFLHRTTEHNSGGERRFVDSGGANFAFTPSLRPNPASLGDGRGFKRFRTTDRVTPSGLDQQLESQDQVNNDSVNVFQSGGSLSQRWW